MPMETENAFRREAVPRAPLSREFPLPTQTRRSRLAILAATFFLTSKSDVAISSGHEQKSF
jgi:hypothetical protein